MPDLDDLEDAIYSAASAARASFGVGRCPSDREIARFRARLVRLLDELAGETTVDELRAALDRDQVEE